MNGTRVPGDEIAGWGILVAVEKWAITFGSRSVEVDRSGDVGQMCDGIYV